MKAVLQRVTEARVDINGEVVGQIGEGLLVLLCAEPGDTTIVADKMLAKILKLRIFNDDAGKMNRNVQNLDGAVDVAADAHRVVQHTADGVPSPGLPPRAGGLLVVSQFTLAADTASGTRPGFSGAAAPELARALYDHFVQQARLAHPLVHTGAFGADMQVHLVNNGPVTISLHISH